MMVKRGTNRKGGKRNKKGKSSFHQSGYHKAGKSFHHYSRPYYGDFYPHNKPSEYSYTNHFVDEFGGRTAGLARTNTKYPGLGEKKDNVSVILDKALSNLQPLIDGARDAELNFLAATGMDVTQMDGRSIFQAINQILNSEQTFNRGLEYMKLLSETRKKDDPEKDKMYRDVSRYFAFYLNKVIAKEFSNLDKTQFLTKTPKQIEALVNRLIGNALIESYTRVKDFVDKDGNITRGKFGDKAKARDGEQLQARQAITDMIDVVKKLKKSGAFGKYGYLFDLNTEDVESLWERGQASQPYLKKKTFDNAKVDSKYGGNALELLTTVVGAEIGRIHLSVGSGDLRLNIEGVHTGQMNQMKGDTILFVGHGDINIPDYLGFIDRETYGGQVRRQNIDAMARYIESLNNNIEHMIVISDKNYSITANFEGVEAQSKMNLKNAGAMLSDFGVGQIPELITYLANCGANMVQGDVNAEIRTTLQSYIAYFLFDHLDIRITGPRKPQANVVNLLNVGGIYMPLSVYLQGIKDSINTAKLSTTGLVSVTISLGGPWHQRVWTESTWTRFRDLHETQSFIEYRILKNMAEYITNLMGL